MALREAAHGFARLVMGVAVGKDAAAAPIHRRVEQLREVLRGWVADRLEIEVGYESYAEA